MKDGNEGFNEGFSTVKGHEWPVGKGQREEEENSSSEVSRSKRVNFATAVNVGQCKETYECQRHGALDCRTHFSSKWRKFFLLEIIKTQWTSEQI